MVKQTPSIPLNSVFPPKRNSLLQIMSVVLVLASGLVIGSALTFVYLRRQLVDLNRFPSERVTVTRIVTHMQRECDLTSEETEKVTQIFQEHVRTLGMMRRRAAMRVTMERDHLRQRMQQALPQDKYRQWETGYRSRADRFERFFGLSSMQQESGSETPAGSESDGEQ